MDRPQSRLMFECLYVLVGVDDCLCVRYYIDDGLKVLISIGQFVLDGISFTSMRYY